jgi:hypothetical protein
MMCYYLNVQFQGQRVNESSNQEKLYSCHSLPSGVKAFFHVLMFWQIGCLVSDMTDVGAYMPHHLQSYCFTVVWHLSVSFDFGGQVIGSLLPIKSPGNLSLCELSTWTLSPESRQIDSGCIMSTFVMSWCFVLRNYILSCNFITG